jgi:phospholipid N-methyltransferase
LGPGTGAFTRCILERGIAPEDITMVEMNPAFAAMLRKEFPKARVLNIDASKLTATQLFDDKLAGAAVSAIPFLLLSPNVAQAILSGAFRWLRPGASVYQVTYGLKVPVPAEVLEALGLKAKQIAFTILNVPPARVYRLFKCRN